jgi:5-methylcytosine-specific restriction endonuclease McrA
VIKEKVEVLSYQEKIVHGTSGFQIRIPAVMKLIKFIRSIYRSGVPYSKKNILIRDEFKCGYCGKKASPLTVDHIIPRSRGGLSTFENCVACCKYCNTHKGCHTPSEAHMALKRKPYQPTISEFLRIKLRLLKIDDLLEQVGGY